MTAKHGGRDRILLELRRSVFSTSLLILLIAGGLVAATIIVRNLAGEKPWVHYNHYRIAFDNPEGVNPGRAELRLLGLKAGVIKATEIVGSHGVLNIDLEKKYGPLYRNARVRIRPVTPLEDMYVDIESRGSPRAGKLPGGEILPVTRTQSAVEVGRVLDVFDPQTRAHLATLLRELSNGTDGRGEQLREAFVQLAPFLQTAGKMSQALADRRHQLARMVHNFGGMTTVLAHRDTQLAQLVRSGQATLGELARNDAPLDETLRQLPPVLTSLRTSLTRLQATETDLDPALRALQPTADRLPNGLNALNRFAVEATPALTALRPSVHQLRPLARALRPTAKRVTNALAPLAGEAPKLDRSTRLAVPCLPETSKFLNRFLSLTKWGDGDHNYAQARALVMVDLNTPGEVLSEPNYRIALPCFMRKVTNGGTNDPKASRP